MSAVIVDKFIRGVPYAKSKTKGRLQAPKAWSDQIRAQTSGLAKVSEACELEVEFILPFDKFPPDYPFGMDLDNLLKRLLDALGQTVLSEAPGTDSAVVTVRATKRKVRPGEEPGARVKIKTARFDE